MAANSDEHLDRFDNAEAAHDHVEQREEQRREDLVETAEQLSTWEKLQREREKRAQTVHVWGESIELYPAGTDPITEVLEFTRSLDENQVEMIEQATDGDDQAIDELRDAVESGGETAEMFGAICDIMTEYSVDESMSGEKGRARWGRLPPELVMQAFEDWADGGLDVQEREEIDQFPGE